MSEKNNVVKIPEGYCARYQCSDCVFYDRSEYNKYGECYCRIRGKYYSADDSTCGDFEYRR